MVSLPSLLTLTAAPSKEDSASSAMSSPSVRVLAPVSWTVTSVSLLQLNAAESVEVRVRPLRTRVTPVVPFLTVTLPSAQEPVIS